MIPGSSVSGLYFWHPDAPTSAWAASAATSSPTTRARKGWSLAEAERWLALNVVDEARGPRISRRLIPALYSARPVAPRSTNRAVGQFPRAQPETTLTSNVAQSYPYTSRDRERAAGRASSTRRRNSTAWPTRSPPRAEPLADAAARRSPGRPDLTWVFVCPRHVSGRLHVAGVRPRAPRACTSSATRVARHTCAEPVMSPHERG